MPPKGIFSENGRTQSSGSIGTGKSKELFRNVGTLRLERSKTASIPENKGFGLFLYEIKHNFLLMAFITCSIIVIILLLYAFFPYMHHRTNAYIVGSFKRPLPADPTKYYDVACIDIHNYATFQNEDQVEMCHNSRPFVRGPVLFGGKT